MPLTTVKVLVRKDFEHAGRRHQAGQMVDLAPIDAAIWARKGYVNLSKQPIQTRDMRADASVVVPRRRRQYRRADLTAEE